MVSVATLAIPFLGRWSSVFGFVPLTTLQMGTVIAIVVGYIIATEGVKVWFYGHKSERSRRFRHE
jgi:Mg2+-importing ATPase